MKNRALLLLTVMAFLVGPIAFVSRAAGQDNVWRDFSEWEVRRKALNRVGEDHETAPRYRRRVAPATHLRDINRIRALNLELTQAVSQGSALDFEFLAKSAGEINKRGKRLQVDLAFPRSKERDGEKVEVTPDELRKLLTALGSSIKSFVDNPVFKSARVVDARLLIKAKSDLAEVIELSDWVEKSCKKLARSNGMN